MKGGVWLVRPHRILPWHPHLLPPTETKRYREKQMIKRLQEISLTKVEFIIDCS